jgi:hypothetical protein
MILSLPCRHADIFADDFADFRQTLFSLMRAFHFDVTVAASLSATITLSMLRSYADMRAA